MKKKVINIITVILTLAIVFLPFTPAKAIAVNNPSSIIIDQAIVYGDLIETGDWLVLASFELGYAVYPTTYADITFIVRLFNEDGDELGNRPLYANPFFEGGYGKGAISLYFSATEATALGMIWEDAYSLQIIGNPSVTWSGDIPIVTANVTPWESNGTSLLGTKVLSLGYAFQSAWELTTISLISGGALSTYGAAYFEAIIPQLRQMAPSIFSTFFTVAEYYERERGVSYAITLRNQWIGTWLDLTDVGADWNIDPIWIYGLIWTAIMVGIAIPLIAQTGTSKFVTPFVFIMVVFGTWMGFYSYFVGGIAALIAVIAFVNQVSWSKSFA